VLSCSSRNTWLELMLLLTELFCL